MDGAQKVRQPNRMANPDFSQLSDAMLSCKVYQFTLRLLDGEHGCHTALEATRRFFNGKKSGTILPVGTDRNFK